MSIQAFSERLRTTAAELSLTQAEIARRTELSRPTVNRLFNGRAPTVEQLQALAAVFGISAEELAADSDATQVLAQASIGPTAEEHRLVLEELARAKAESLQASAELEGERERRKEAVAARLACERVVEDLRADLERARVAEQQLRGRLGEAQTFGDKWAETSLGQAAHINALERTNATLTRDYAATTEQLQRFQKINQVLAIECQQAQRNNQALALRERSTVDPGAAVLTGVLGLALGGLLGAASGK